MARLVWTTLLLAGPGWVSAAVPVTAAPLATQLVDLEVRAPATVVPANRAVVTAQITALVADVAADVGATVVRGDLLVRLDDADARLALERARADLAALAAEIDQAAARLRRGEELVASNYISTDELEARRTTLAVLEARRDAQVHAVDSAGLALSRTRITAPYPAAVVARSAQVGALAQPGTPLVTLVQTERREVDADVDPRYADGLGKAAEPRLESQRRSYPLTLSRLSPVIEPETRIVKARFRFSGVEAPIGTSGEVVWRVAGGLVPVPLIVQRDGRLGLFVAERDTARFVPLPAAQEGRPAPPADLPPDTLVVVRGQSRLQDGDALTVTRQ